MSRVNDPIRSAERESPVHAPRPRPLRQRERTAPAAPRLGSLGRGAADMPRHKWDEGELIGHSSVVQRRLLHDGHALRAAYVEGVGVRPDRRGQGHGAAMLEVLERVVHGAYELGALAAANEASSFYASRGWKRWHGPTSALTPTGIMRTQEEDGSIYVLPVTAALNPYGELICDWRDGDVW